MPDLLISERLVLRRHHSKDLDAFAGFMTHPTATAYMAFTPEQRTSDGACQMLDYVIDSYETDQPIFSLTIADPHDDSYMGSCGLQPLVEGDGVEVYYTVLPEQQNRGIATEAIRRLLEYLFEQTDTRRVVAYVAPENLPSVRVAQRLGFVDDGPIRRQAQTGQMLCESSSGRRYLLEKQL